MNGFSQAVTQTRVQKELTLQGNIVISVGIFGYSGYKELWKEGVFCKADFGGRYEEYCKSIGHIITKTKCVVR